MFLALFWTSQTDAQLVPDTSGATADSASAAPSMSQSQSAVKIPIWIQNRFTGEVKLTGIPQPDTSLWNPARIDHYQHSLSMSVAPPMGVLVIDKINLEVPVYNGTEELQLNRGAGRIPGTGLFYGDGNLGISSHRDGYFRGLKDLELGDEITVRGVDGDQIFIVSALSVVHKSDLSPLDPSNERVLTLVTCHPFYFVGNAPDRYIVRAVPKA